MKKNIIIFLLFINSLPIFSQVNFCDKYFGDSYFPLNLGIEKIISWYDTSYIESITDSVLIGKKTYFEYKQDFGKNKEIKLFLRNSNDTIFMYNEKAETENILWITQPKVGVNWDNGKVIETNGTFETPYCNYSDLLVIELSYKNDEKEKRYFKKGLGLIGISRKDEIVGMCLPSKQEIKLLFKPVTFKGCENIENIDSRNNCTMNKVNEFIIQNFTYPNEKSKNVKGRFVFNVKISKEGNIKNIESVNKIRKGEEIELSLISILKNLPQFIPAETSPIKKVGTIMTIPVNF